MAIIQCPQCGGNVSDQAARCPHCGKSFTETVGSPENLKASPSTAAPAASTSGKTNTILLVVLIAIVLIGLIVGLVLFLTNKDNAEVQVVEKVDTVKVIQTVISNDDLYTRLQDVVQSRVLTSDEVNQLNENDKRLLRNYVYARHGYIFKDAQLSNYFSQFDWYSGRYTSETAVFDMFSEVERKNVKMLLPPQSANRNQASSAFQGNSSFIGHCNIRAYASTSAPIVATVENGWECFVTGQREGDWYYILLPNGIYGWTHRQNLRF